jgi:hypothetical protein
MRKRRFGWADRIRRWTVRGARESPLEPDSAEWTALDGALAEEGQIRRAAVCVDEERVERVLASFRERLRKSEDVQRHRVKGAIRLLREHLGYLCGERSADQVLRIAASMSSAGNVESLTPQHWTDFTTHLGVVLATLCGITPARAVMEMARSLRMEGRA